MRFADPWVLALLALVPAYVWLRWPRAARAPRATLAFPPLALLDGAPRSRRARLIALPVALRAGVLALAIVALARPRSPGDVRDRDLRGRNIVVALDISSSMKSLDFRPANRIEAAKRVLAQFIRAREGDFMGLVIFASRPFTQAPLTSNADVLLGLLDRVDIGLLPDGTAIGTALAMSENLLKNLPRGTGVIVLLTDGGNNTGSPDPITAAELAKAIGVRIYIVGMSASTGQRIPTDAWVRGMGREYTTQPQAYGMEPAVLTAHDEQTLERIAAISGGAYWRATDPKVLEGIMARIDRIETGTLHQREVLSWHEYYGWLAGAAVALLMLELALRAGPLRTVP